MKRKRRECDPGERATGHIGDWESLHDQNLLKPAVPGPTLRKWVVPSLPMTLFPYDPPCAMWGATPLQPPASDPELTIPAASPWGQQILENPKMCLARAVELWR